MYSQHTTRVVPTTSTIPETQRQTNESTTRGIQPEAHLPTSQSLTEHDWALLRTTTKAVTKQSISTLSQSPTEISTTSPSKSPQTLSVTTPGNSNGPYISQTQTETQSYQSQFTSQSTSEHRQIPNGISANPKTENSFGSTNTPDQLPITMEPPTDSPSGPANRTLPETQTESSYGTVKKN